MRRTLLKCRTIRGTLFLFIIFAVHTKSRLTSAPICR